MEKIKAYFSSFKTSAKSVILNSKEFTGIYIAIIVVQILLGVWTMSAFTGHYSNDRLFKDTYGFDVFVTEARVSLEDLEGICNANDDLVTDCDIIGGKLGVSIKSGSLDEFKTKVLAKNGAEYTVTPYYTYHTEVQRNNSVISLILGIMVLGISILIVSIIHSVRTNHYKFQYGIYVTFGADRKMLAALASRELFTINTLTLIPSAIISYLLCYLTFATNGVTPIIKLSAVIIYILLSYTVVLISAGSAMGSMLFSAPVSLITTADNSNFVTSPRRSFNIFAKKIPLQYEAYSIWRFRKYIIRLVASAVAFSVIFITMIYLGNMIKAANDAPVEEYVIKFKYNPYSKEDRPRTLEEGNEIISYFSQIDAVKMTKFEQSKSVSHLYDHILIKSKNNLKGNDYSVFSTELDNTGYNRATNYYKYVSVDSLTLNNYDKIYDVEYLEGVTADNLAESDEYVIVSEGLYGVKGFSFAPGDKIIVAEMKQSVTLPAIADKRETLEQQIANYKFEYKEYTVGAVIHDADATGSITVGVCEQDYERYTGDKKAISEIKVYLENDTDIGVIKSMRSNVEEFMTEYESWDCEYTNGTIYSLVDRRIGLDSVIFLLSSLILIICPLIWIFSQIMFFKKRETEFRTLTHIGIVMKRILGIHIVSGAVLFIFGFVLNLVLGRAACYGIYRLLTYFLPSVGVNAVSAAFDSFVPLWIIFVCAAVFALCGMISGILPFIIFERKLENERRMAKSFEFGGSE